ncbi:mitochondrial import inner membrane translocase subunit Tim29 [Neopsephotus bourkii]|uniref:mitochondrial import inner membrane translocase subunit Tim29 n=1 Tax=Neopsephotus bourkii TaxID=309878 RepID=UPI002AA57C08|nr:mitochondrial import inner membrane translocase subunit Tim29 [Neopsephotus bourkii]
MAAAAVGAGRGLWAWMARTRLGRWCSALLQDYAAALRETAQGARRRPLASAVTVAALGAVTACGASVPSADSFEAAAVEAAGSLLLLSPGTRSPDAERHVQRLLRRREAGRLRYRHLVLLAVVYEAPPGTGAGAQLYSSRCRYLRPPWRQAPARLLDVGFCGRWWLLRHRLRDCDVNEDEFRALPPRLRRLEPRQLRSEHNERLFLRKYEPAALGTGDQEEEEEA